MINLYVHTCTPNLIFRFFIVNKILILKVQTKVCYHLSSIGKVVFKEPIQSYFEEIGSCGSLEPYSLMS